jgi:DNA-binding transcriptional MerR regulator
MDYTINRLATMSGVTVRTLRFYDEIGLLKPAYVADNGYRYYQKKELLLLQQILFFRELGFELKDIQRILKQSDFDKREALRIHKKELINKINRMTELIKTVDNTIKDLEGKTAMDDKKMFQGFDAEKQLGYELYLVERFGDKIKKQVAQSHHNTKGWRMQEWNTASQEFAVICRELTDLLEKKYAPDSERTQALITRHYDWIRKFWTPDKESYAGLAKLYTEPEWKKTFELYHPELALYLSEAMQSFARKLP